MHAVSAFFYLCLIYILCLVLVHCLQMNGTIPFFRIFLMLYISPVQNFLQIFRLISQRSTHNLCFAIGTAQFLALCGSQLERLISVEPLLSLRASLPRVLCLTRRGDVWVDRTASRGALLLAA